MKSVAAGMNPMDLKRGIDLATPRSSRRSRRCPCRSTTATKLRRSAPSRPTAKRNRSSDRGRDAESRQRGCHHRRREQGPGDRDRCRRRHAVRPWLPQPLLRHQPDKMIAELEDCMILLHEKKLSSLQPMVPLLESVIQSQKPLLIICRRCRRRSPGHAGRQQAARRSENRAVKAPGFGDRRKAMLQDIAILTGGQVISEDLGMKLETVTMDMLGTAKRSRSPRTRPPSSTVPVKRPRSKPASARSVSRSRKPPPTTTVRSCKSVLPSWPAALLSSASAA